MKTFILLIAGICIYVCPTIGQPKTQTKATLIAVDSGWAKNSVNVVSFRKNGLVSHEQMQFIAFYDPHANVIIGMRKHGSAEWTLSKTPFSGNASDAHNAISIMVDGEGYIHMAWDHHNSKLKYARSTEPLSLEFREAMMTGIDEKDVTYPEFFRMKNGNLLFLYRNGESGRGRLVMNVYDTGTKQWTQLHNNLLDGEDQRNAYWQCYIDNKGTIHLSWVWRETADVATNHDMCYAKSMDNGRTWLTMRNTKYTLPINAGSAEYAWRIPQKSELINQTSMSADNNGNPFIASYWRNKDSDIPQYQLLWADNTGKWNNLTLSFRETPFSLSGMGTKRIPIARPQIVVEGKGKKAAVYLIFRDQERSNHVSVAMVRMRNRTWQVEDIWHANVGSWEPVLDTEYWKHKKAIHLLLQHAEQTDGEGLAELSGDMVYVLEWRP